MIYLLTLGWPWFAGALALGALVGFLTYKKAKEDARLSGGWVIVAGALALAMGGLVSTQGLLEGADAMRLDIALLAGLAYAAGLPVGGWLKSSGGDAPAKARPAVFAPVVAARAPTTVSPEPLESQSPPVEARAPESLAPLQPSSPSQAAVTQTKKAAPGARPETFAAPRNGAPDDLSRIKGVGPKTLEKLHALGVFHYDQIAVWNLDNARWIGAAINAPGRVERDKWIQQARALTSAGAEQ